MRGLPRYNFPAFDAARDLLKAQGWTAVSPADIDRENGLDETAAHEFTPSEIRDFARRDLAAIVECDAIALLPGWERSRGATAEKAVADWIGLPIYDATTGEPYEPSVLQTALRITRGDRHDDYGHPGPECERIAAFWSIVLGVQVKAEQVPLCMIGMKISREMHSPKRDNYVDIAGYADVLSRVVEYEKTKGRSWQREPQSVS